MKSGECRCRGRVGKWVTLPVNGLHQPVYPDPLFGYAGQTGEFMAFPSCFEVVSGAVTLSGLWTERAEAERFAAGVPCDQDGKKATIREASYWYAPAWGRVE